MNSAYDSDNNSRDDFSSNPHSSGENQNPGGYRNNVPPPIPPVRKFPHRDSSNGCLLAVIFTLGFFAIFIIGGAILLRGSAQVAGKFLEKASESVSAARNANNIYEEVLVNGDTASRIAVIPITGAIYGTGNAYYGAGTVNWVTSLLRKISEDDTVKAVILHIDSPGGGLSASDIIHNEIQQLQNKGKKIIVNVDQLCASGGYYIAAPADYIVAGPTALIGSFGVIMEHVEVTGLLEKLGIVVDPLKSTDSKDIGSPFRKMTPEEKTYFQHVLTTYHNRFIDIIVSGRKLPREKVEKLANGKIYLAEEALNYGLIDEIGYFNSSLKEAKKACTVDYPEIFTYKKQLSFMNLLGAESKSQLPSISEFMNKNSGTELNLIYRGVQTGNN